jgi:arylsulfatase A-like enzyme
MIRNEAPDYGYKYPPEEYAVTFERIGGMDTREVLLPQVLKRAGYTSGIYGKWDLGMQRRYLPLARGFDDFYGFVNTGIDYFTHQRYGVPSMYRNNSPTEEDKGTYCTQLFLREALRFLDTAGEQPFFLYVPFNAPHNASNLDPTIRSGAQGTDSFKALYPKLGAKADVQPATKYGKPAMVRNKASRRLEYLAAVSEMDAAIGQLLAKVDQMGKTQETIVIFMSDNGGGGAADNTPLRGRKAQMWEGGIRVPAIIVYPQVVPEATTNDAFCTSMDLFPTICEWCSAELPDVVIDGKTLASLLSGASASPRNSMFWKRRSDKAARIGKWKWVQSKSGGGLFDLETDVGESNDLSKARPAKLTEMIAAFEDWETEMEAAEPRGPFRDF